VINGRRSATKDKRLHLSSESKSSYGRWCRKKTGGQESKANAKCRTFIGTSKRPRPIVPDFEDVQKSANREGKKAVKRGKGARPNLREILHHSKMKEEKISEKNRTHRE